MEDCCDNNSGFDELTQKCKALELENKKLARELRALNRRNEIDRLNLNTQTGLNRVTSLEKQAQEMYLKLIMETCPDLIFIFNKNLEFQSGSKSLEEHLGVADVSLLFNRTLSSIIERYNPPALTDTVVEHVTKVIDSLGTDISNETISIDAGSHKYAGSIIPFFKKNNEFIGVYLLITDVTDLAKREIAEHESRSKSNFLARMSHEIRTPLGAIMGMAELSLREDLPAAAVEFISTIIQAGENLLDIINDILDLSKIETGQLDIISDEYMITSLINDVISIIKPKTLNSRLRFIVDVDCAMPGILKGDVVRIRQVMLNLLSNAVKYTDQGFVYFLVKTEIIDEENVNLIIKVEDSGRGIKKEDIPSIFDEYTRFDINTNKDSVGTGLGLAITYTLINAMGGEIDVISEVGEGSIFTATIPQEIISKTEVASVKNPESQSVLIFERREILIDPIIHTMNSLGVRYKLVSDDKEFHEELKSNKYSFIFLAAILYDIAKSKYEDMETDATVVLVAEFGDVIPAKNIRILTTPIFSIPCANIFNGVEDNYTRSPGENLSQGFTAPDSKVLIVDDINTNLIVAKGLIEPYDIQVDVCTGGKEAIEAVSSTKYDLIFMDHMMPEMDGVEATRQIREMGGSDSYYKDVPVIALTANSILCSQDMFMTSGFSDFLSKPIETKKLDEILKKWVPEHKQKFSEVEPGIKRDSIENAGNSDLLLNNIDGIDVEKGILISGGTIEYFFETIASFSSDILERFELIRGCINTKDISGYTTYVHAIRSASANIGADNVSKLALDLENAGNKGDWDFIISNNDAFLNELERLRESIDAALSIYDKNEDNENDTERKEKIKKELYELTKALDAYDIVTVNKTVNTLLTLVKTEDEKIKMREISNHILLFEYDEAYRLIKKL